jgi:transcription initiation factor IIE alpha subunit
MEATSTVPMKPCGVCGKPIEEPKFRIHEATCARNNFKCPKCAEIIPKSEKDHHEQEFHVKVSSLHKCFHLTKISF